MQVDYSQRVEPHHVRIFYLQCHPDHHCPDDADDPRTKLVASQCAQWPVKVLLQSECLAGQWSSSMNAWPIYATNHHLNAWQTLGNGLNQPIMAGLAKTRSPWRPSGRTIRQGREGRRPKVRGEKFWGNHNVDNWTVFVRTRSVHGLVDCGQSWRSFPAEILLSDGGGRGESAAHHQLRQSDENVRYKEFPKRNTNLQVTADQCHRGYTLASDSSNGLMSLNPLYIRFHQQQHLNPLLLHTSWKTQDQSPKAEGLVF